MVEIDIHVVVDAIQELDDATMQLTSRAALVEEINIIVGGHHIGLPGERPMEKAFSDAEFVELIVGS